MRRADRLFQIIQILRRTTRPVTANDMAAELEVSQRTVYRDIADLIAQHVPISGEAGFGYVLDDAFDMPPLMLTPEEIEAAALGAQWVAANADPVLASAAEDLIAKITSVVPEKLRPAFAEPSSRAVNWNRGADDRIDMAKLREWIRRGLKVEIEYGDEKGDKTRRIVWPIIIGYFENRRMLASWCELRQDFRHFRTDRIMGATFLDEAHGSRPGELRHRWKRDLEERIAKGG